MKLLPPELLVKTGPIDQARWNYSRLFGYLQRQRFKLAARLVGDRQFDSLLEIGYGSGIFMPFLAEHCKNLFGLDIHENCGEVQNALQQVGVSADMRRGSATELPFEDDSMDAIVAVSVLEFVEPVEKMAQELARVCKPSAVLIVICPAQSYLLDLALRISTGGDAQHYYQNRRAELLPALQTYFVLDRQLVFPPLFSLLGLRVYHAWELSPRK